MPSRSLRHIGQIGMAALLWALALGGPSAAQAGPGNGDGSESDNLRLLPGVYPAAPVDPLPADFPGLREPYSPFFNIDWSVALRGAYTKTGSGEQFDVIVAPGVSLEHTGSRSQIGVDASAEIDQPVDDRINVGALRLGLSADYALDPVTTLSANADLAITREQAGTPGLASNVVEAPRTIFGSVDGGVTRRFGRFNVGVTGAIERSVYGDSVLSGGIVRNNSEDDFWHLDSGLRVGFQATPVLEVFAQGNLGRDMFDHPSSVLLVKPDANDIAIRGGVAGKWSSVLMAEASTGINLRRFDAASLGEVTSRLYDARLVFTPDPTWRFSAGLTTTVAPPGPDSGGTTRVEYAADAKAQYIVNSWLLLRAAADWNTARLEGSTATESGYGYGVGADYSLNAHTALTADYGYAHEDSSSERPQDSHKVTVGVTVSR